MQLAEHAGAEAHLFGWYLGIGIAFAVIVVVVLLVAIILTLARRIGAQAQEAIRGLDAARVNSLPLWDVDKANESARRIVEAMRAARGALGG
ncbi:MAG: hypothetical protein ACRDIU_08730 [Actinomycetota bacterium]